MTSFTRKPDIKILVDIWDWKTGSIDDTLDITGDIISYRFQKSIKTPKGSCQIQSNPQTSSAHLLDSLSAMDVVKIFEFGILKFQGYITRLSYSGMIDSSSGKPKRNLVITVVQMGGLLVDARTGMGLGTALGNPSDELWTYTSELSVAISNVVNDKKPYKDIFTTLIEGAKTYIKKLGGKDANPIINYLETYFRYGSGLDNSITSVIPREFYLFTGSEQSIGFWNISERLVERPFNEFFMDNGPRQITINGRKVSLSEYSHFIFRPTPFDGTVGSGNSSLFSDMESIIIDRNHLVRMDLSKGMDEVYTTYCVKNSAFDPGDEKRQLLGEYIIDGPKLGKYMFRPLVAQQAYTRFESPDKTESEAVRSRLVSTTKDMAQTLKAWFTHNDEYLSGAITLIIPSDDTRDPRIGEKVEIDGLSGAFYVEGIAHTWTYMGALQSNLSVTRGYNDNSKITLSENTLFRRSILQ